MRRPDTPARLIATFFGAGLLPAAPGTWGSLAALPVGWALHLWAGPAGLLLGIVLATGIGWWATAQVMAATDDPDPSEVVIDEVAGQWIALLPLSLLAPAAVAADAAAIPWVGLVLAFALFRLFDIWKPGPIGMADRMHTPWGLMLDDLLAGVAAAALVAVPLLAGLI
ncbi:MAG: phosphatidylglycerophosphatase A [Rhodobacteraceae bacterium]|nr:phosphatidylglycerophosphatase A [Paracoccaceae bacterium]